MIIDRRGLAIGAGLQRLEPGEEQAIGIFAPRALLLAAVEHGFVIAVASAPVRFFFEEFAGDRTGPLPLRGKRRIVAPPGISAAARVSGVLARCGDGMAVLEYNEKAC